MYDYIITTHLPSFYKINLYNELSKKMKIFVVFIAKQSEERTKDFIEFNCDFNYAILNTVNIENRNIFQSTLKLEKLIRNLNYKKIIIGGWDLAEFRMLMLRGNKKKNMLVLESTIFESKINGIKGLIKKMLLSRINTVFASGDLHRELLNGLNYKGRIKITKGVGIINKPEYELERKEYTKKFLYLGRLSSEKNLEMLIQVFNSLPDYQLSIIGKGSLLDQLQAISEKNISFLNHIDNKKLPEVFHNHNVLILPSISEPWGLVVEEALYFSLPIIISKNCGAVELVENGLNGFIVDPYSFDNIKNTILQIDSKMYKNLLEGTKQFSIEEKDREQLDAYM